MLQQYLRDANVHQVTATVRPYSQWVPCFRGSIAFQLSVEEFHFIEMFCPCGCANQSLGRAVRLTILEVSERECSADSCATQLANVAIRAKKMFQDPSRLYSALENNPI